jgi:hypothetical protein
LGLSGRHLEIKMEEPEGLLVVWRFQVW